MVAADESARLAAHFTERGIMPDLQPSQDAQAMAIAVAFRIVHATLATPVTPEKAKTWGPLIGDIAQEMLAKTNSIAVGRHES